MAQQRTAAAPLVPAPAQSHEAAAAPAALSPRARGGAALTDRACPSRPRRCGPWRRTASPARARARLLPLLRRGALVVGPRWEWPRERARARPSKEPRLALSAAPLLAALAQVALRRRAAAEAASGPRSGAPRSARAASRASGAASARAPQRLPQRAPRRATCSPSLASRCALCFARVCTMCCFLLQVHRGCQPYARAHAHI